MKHSADNVLLDARNSICAGIRTSLTIAEAVEAEDMENLFVGYLGICFGVDWMGWEEMSLSGIWVGDTSAPNMFRSWYLLTNYC